MSSSLRFLGLLLVFAFTAISVNADSATYTFEGPQFSPGESTPILNRSPNLGPATFQASFTSASVYLIAAFPGASPLLIDNILYSPTPSVLTITFNMPVYEVQFSWAQEFPGPINFVSSVGNQSQNSADVGGFFQGGTFSFSSATPFTSFSLAAFDTSALPTNLGIDDLIVTTAVPEPATLVLLGSGLVGLAKLRRRKRNLLESRTKEK